MAGFYVIAYGDVLHSSVSTYCRPTPAATQRVGGAWLAIGNIFGMILCFWAVDVEIS